MTPCTKCLGNCSNYKPAGAAAAVATGWDETIFASGTEGIISIRDSKYIASGTLELYR